MGNPVGKIFEILLIRSSSEANGKIEKNKINAKFLISLLGDVFYVIFVLQPLPHEYKFEL